MFIRNSQTIYINSKQRTSGTDEDFQITLNLEPSNNFTHVSVLGASIPKSYYSIQHGQNTFVVREIYADRTDEYVITVPEGNYSINSFVITLKGLFEAEGLIEYSVIQENSRIQATTGKLTFLHEHALTHTASFNFLNNNIADLMGFDRLSTVLFSLPNSEGTEILKSKNIVNFQAESQIYLHSDICLSHNDDILLSIFGTGEPYLSNMIFENQDIEAYSKPILRKDSNNFHFYITNEFGNIINLNGVDMLITLLCYEKQNIYKLIKTFMNYQIKKDDDDEKKLLK